MAKFVSVQAGIVAGAMLAPLVNSGTKYIHAWGWRLSFAIPLLPALLLLLAGLILPDTPNSLLARGKPAEVKTGMPSTRCIQLKFSARMAVNSEIQLFLLAGEGCPGAHPGYQERG